MQCDKRGWKRVVIYGRVENINRPQHGTAIHKNPPVNLVPVNEINLIQRQSGTQKTSNVAFYFLQQSSYFTFFINQAIFGKFTEE